MKKRTWKRMRKRDKVIERPRKREAAGRVTECTVYPIQLASQNVPSSFSSFLYHHHNYHTNLSNSTDARNFNIFHAIDVTVKVKSSQISFIAWKIRKIGEASADTAATEAHYMKGYYNLEEETIKVKI